MNRTETRYAELLELRRLAGELAAWRFECWKVRIGPVGEQCWYQVDFLVIAADGMVEWHEVKGKRIMDDARVKLLAAAEEYPWFRWVRAQWIKKQWHYERYGGGKAWRDGSSS